MAKRTKVDAPSGDPTSQSDTAVTGVPTPEEIAANLADHAAATIMEQTPEVQQHVINQHKESEASAPVDSTGAKFDPTIHATGADGSGTLTAKGVWKKRRGTASRIGTAASGTGTQSSAAGTQGPSQKEVQARAVGTGFAHMTFMLGMAFGGSEWKPRTKSECGFDESEMLTDAYTQYAMAHEMKDLPPGVVLLSALAIYAAPRFSMPETRQRASRVKSWLGLRIAKWKLKRELKKRGITAVVKVEGDTILIDGKDYREFKH
jgi:hypothetical protein